MNEMGESLLSEWLTDIGKGEVTKATQTIWWFMTGTKAAHHD